MTTDTITWANGRIIRLMDWNGIQIDVPEEYADEIAVAIRDSVLGKLSWIKLGRPNMAELVDMINIDHAEEIEYEE